MGECNRWKRRRCLCKKKKKKRALFQKYVACSTALIWAKDWRIADGSLLLVLFLCFHTPSLKQNARGYVSEHSFTNCSGWLPFVWNVKKMKKRNHWNLYETISWHFVGYRWRPLQAMIHLFDGLLLFSV